MGTVVQAGAREVGIEDGDSSLSHSWVGPPCGFQQVVYDDALAHFVLHGEDHRLAAEQLLRQTVILLEGKGSITTVGVFIKTTRVTCASSSVPSFSLREESRAGRMTPRWRVRASPATEDRKASTRVFTGRAVSWRKQRGQEVKHTSKHNEKPNQKTQINLEW